MKKFTDWFKAHQQPARVGVYQRKIDKCCVRYNYWDGEKWYFSSDTVERALKNYKDRWESILTPKQWRGLAEEPI